MARWPVPRIYIIRWGGSPRQQVCGTGTCRSPDDSESAEPGSLLARARQASPLQKSPLRQPLGVEPPRNHTAGLLSWVDARRGPPPSLFGAIRSALLRALASEKCFGGIWWAQPPGKPHQEESGGRSPPEITSDVVQADDFAVETVIEEPQLVSGAGVQGGAGNHGLELRVVRGLWTAFAPLAREACALLNL